ncbi:hypothetical protein TARUN_4763 [Trichoderma arundinaceum]|uniref:Uncharacterized protein n=1 Tax=Trichoderma arundinaceum TaxID=490622 RepID=A0A395NN07_TRIAR|nr:hypothetical protein TARUN_4763 [Trichoderma arundinaceum]
MDRPTKFQNDADLLDCDLRDIFNTAILDIDLSNEDFDDLDQRSQDLLITLNAMVNEDVIPCVSEPAAVFKMSSGPCGFGPPDSYDIERCQPPVLQNPVGVIMDALFEEFQQANCGALHQIKLRVFEEQNASSCLPELEMLMSCCQTGCDWQEVFPDIHDKIGPGNPVLLSFAKLLLEIINGEKIDLDVDPQNANKNIGNWAKICGYVEEARQDGNSFYLQAVQGCLYLHMHAQQITVSQISPDSSNISTKKVIYEQIVQNLEKELNPEGLKRKRQNSLSESRRSKKPYIMELPGKKIHKIEHITRQNSKSPLAISSSYRGTNYSQAPQTFPGDFTSFFKYNSSEGLSQSTFSRVTMTTNAPQERDDFDVAIICAIATEYNAVCQIFDEFWDEEGDRYGRAAGDLNTYTTGRIGKHNVVLALLPRIGKSSAAAAAASFRSSYSSVELALLVGICGGVPCVGGYVEDQILLGDVVISKAVVQYDFGKKYPDKFARKDTFEDNLSKAAKNIQSLLKNFETDRGLSLLQNQSAQFLLQLQNAGSRGKQRVFTKYRYPGAINDRLFRPEYRHKHRGIRRCSVCESESGSVCEDALNATCEELGCEEGYFVGRERLQEKEELEKDGYEEAQAPAIHLGAVASGDTVLKSGKDRDEIAQKEGVIAFEMEGAGIWEEIPCIIVKGVCDYADSHKNKKWQDFAAATAAAATKALLQRYPKTEKARYW